MKKIFAIILLLINSSVFAQEAVNVALEKAPVNIHDTASIKRGAKFFANNCMVCHTMIYLRYNKLAKDAGVVYDKMPINVTTWPLGVKPPDLSLVANIRGADWIYTYLHSFYADPARPTGFNNLLMPNTAMSGIVAPYQGKQVLAPANEMNNKIYMNHFNWYDLLVLENQGSMTPEQFDQTVTDVVNFLVYAADPYRAQQEKIGYAVLFFMFIFFVLTFFLKKSYWDSLESKKHDKKK